MLKKIVEIDYYFPSKVEYRRLIMSLINNSYKKLIARGLL